MSGSASGRHCTDPVTCEFFDRCNPPRPSDHIGYLPRIHSRTDVFPPCTVAFLRRLNSVTQSCTARKTLALFGDEKLFISTTRTEVAASKNGA